MTVNVMPATLSVPVRDVVAVLAVAEKLTVPLPLPEPPVVIVSHEAPLVAAHAHPVTAFTPTEPDDAPAASAAELADSVGAHGALRANAFDTVLVVEPPGPMAVMRDS